VLQQRQQPGDIHRDPACLAPLLDLSCRFARTEVGGALGREALDTGTVASGASNPGDRPRDEPRAPARKANDRLGWFRIGNKVFLISDRGRPAF
jgi:hypothetical protein